ncbi:MAG: thiamine phosphate synthase [Thermodesulfovibrionales bacterium]|nr:thiamine phosphate synthase [Thermodesulfovibrionales bacterium]
MKNISKICFLTPSGLNTDELLQIVETVLQLGIKWVQYRDKIDSKRLIYDNAIQLRKLTKTYKAILSINDYTDIAIAIDADGVHLGQEDLPLKEARKIIGDKIIGISTHSISEAINAYEGGANYIGFGPIFYTTTKDAGTPKGLEELKKVVNLVKIPVLAIGGISVENLKSVVETGCYGVAVSSGLLKGDVNSNTTYFLKLLKIND